MQSWLMTMRDGGVNLAAIVGWIFFAIGTIPLVFFVGVKRSREQQLKAAPAPAKPAKKSSEH